MAVQPEVELVVGLILANPTLVVTVVVEGGLHASITEFVKGPVDENGMTPSPHGHHVANLTIRLYEGLRPNFAILCVSGVIGPCQKTEDLLPPIKIRVEVCASPPGHAEELHEAIAALVEPLGRRHAVGPKGSSQQAPPGILRRSGEDE